MPSFCLKNDLNFEQMCQIYVASVRHYILFVIVEGDMCLGDNRFVFLHSELSMIVWFSKELYELDVCLDQFNCQE